MWDDVRSTLDGQNLEELHESINSRRDRMLYKDEKLFSCCGAPGRKRGCDLSTSDIDFE